MLSLILSRRDIKENDQIISLYTLEKGKMEVLARGVKKITSKNSAHLEPFSLVNVEIISGKELVYLGSVESVNYFKNIRENLQKSLSAGFVVSLLDKVLHEGEKDERIFVLLRDFLEFLNDKSVENYVSLLDSFVLRLLGYLGYDMEESKTKKLTHKNIYKFLVYNTDRKISDWKKN